MIRRISSHFLKARCGILLIFCLVLSFCQMPLSGQNETCSLADLPPEIFLAYLRTPLQQDSWMQCAARLTWKAKGKNKTLSKESQLLVRLTFSANAMQAQITQDQKNLYLLEQTYGTGIPTAATLTLPTKETPPGLADFGITPADLTFAFLYWNFHSELTTDSQKKKNQRRLRLLSPDRKESVQILFQASTGFPMEVKWFSEQDPQKPQKSLTLKGIRRHANGLWFVREARIESDTWKTRVLFDDMERNEIGE